MKNGRYCRLGGITLGLLLLLLTASPQLSASVASDIHRQSPAADHQITIYANQAIGAFNPNLLGSNLPAWIGSEKTERLANAQFQQRVKATGVTLLRAPGSSWGNQYGWLSCELGVNQPKTQPCGDAWVWAARPSDYIGLAKATNSNLMWTVNPNGTAKEAAALVAFFNGRIDDNTRIGLDQNGFDWQTVGAWAQLRAIRGYPEPLGVQWWQVGNELYGNKNCIASGWEIYWTCDADEYIKGKGAGLNHRDGFIDFNTAMKAVDSSIQLGAVGWISQTQYNNWGNKVIAGAGDVMGFYTVHHFPFNDAAPIASTGQQILTQAFGTWQAIKTDIDGAMKTLAPGKNIPIAVTQYSLATRATLPQTNKLHLTTAYALFMADSIGQMAAQGYRMANQWNMASGDDITDTDFGLIRIDHQLQRTPAYYVLPIWDKFGSAMLGVSHSFSAANQLSVYAGHTVDGAITLLAINKTSNNISSNISVQGALGPLFINAGDAFTLRSTGLDDPAAIYNGVATPADDLSNAPPLPLVSQSQNGQMVLRDYTFAPYSITLLRLSTQSAQVKSFMPLVQSSR